MQQKFSAAASAPGKLVILGEHAVLHGEMAIACAINKRITVRATRLDDPLLQVVSEFGAIEYQLDAIPANPEQAFVCEAARLFIEKFQGGLLLNIESDIPHNKGLGSSAATTAATVAAINNLLAIDLDELELFNTAKQALAQAQSTGSSIDLAASIFGGTIAYRAQPFACSRLNNNPSFVTIFTGSKTPTTQVIDKVKSDIAHDRQKYNKIFKAIGNISKDAIVVINQSNWTALGELVQKQQVLMEEMGLANSATAEAVNALHSAGITGAKISGAGLGDCVIGITDPNTELQVHVKPPLELLNLEIDTDGVRYEP